MLRVTSGYLRAVPGLRHVGSSGRTPEDKPPRAAANVGSCGIVMALAFVLMALLDSGDLRSAARDLPGNRLTDELVRGADRWHELMAAAGLAQVRPAVRGLFDDLRGIDW